MKNNKQTLEDLEKSIEDGKAQIRETGEKLQEEWKELLNTYENESKKY